MKKYSISLSVFALLAFVSLSTQAQVGVFTGNMDIDGGQLELAGSAEFDRDTGTYTVIGGGHDIWDEADDFHYAYMEMSGDFDIRGRVSISQGTSDWTKTMLMARQNLTPGSPNIGTRVRGLDGQFSGQQRSEQDSGGSSTDGALRVTGVNGQMQRLVKRGNQFGIFYKLDGDADWSLIEWRTLDLADPYYLGIAVTSHTVGELATGTVSELEIIPGNQFTQATTWNGGLGIAPLPGSAVPTDGGYILNGNGRDIWETADDGYFLYTNLAGDGAITAKVRWIDGGENSDWAKAGIMIRDDGDDPSSQHYWIELRSGPVADGVALGDQTDAQWRDSTGGASGNTEILQADGSKLFSPDGVWYRVVKNGTEFSSFYSLDGNDWVLANTNTIDFGDDWNAYGLVVTSHTQDDEIVTAEFTDVSVGTSSVQTSNVGDEWSLYE